MSPTEQERHTHHSNATPARKYLYGHVDAGKKLRGIFVKNGLTEDLYDPYALTIGDVILGFYEETQLPQLLKEKLGISDSAALRLTADLLDFLEPLHDPNWQPPVEAGLGEDFVSTTTNPAPTNVAVPAEPLITTPAPTAPQHNPAPPIPLQPLPAHMRDLVSQAPNDIPAYQSEQPSGTLRPRAVNPKAPSPGWRDEE